MSEPNSLQALSKISKEAEESEIKINLNNLCIKAHQDFAHKLQRESKRRKEICNFVRNSNLQLETEIKNAEKEIKSMLATNESIKSSNVELKKELLLSKENNLRIRERIKKGETKYDELWLQSNKRYESTSFVQKWLQATRKTETLKANVTIFENDAKTLHKDIKTKKEVLLELDRKHIVQLAEFLVHEMPGTLTAMKEKSVEINKLTESLDAITKDQEMKNKKLPVLSLPPPENSHTKVVDDSWPNLSTYINDKLMMPRLQLGNTEQDVLNVNLKLNKIVMIETATVKRSDSVTGFEKSASKRFNKEDELNSDFVSSYLNKPIGQEPPNDLKDKAKSYSTRKLINILKDIKLDDNETYSLVAEVNPVKLQEVNMISANTFHVNDFVETSKTRQLQTCTHTESEEIEDIDLAESNSQNILNPPTQFIDIIQDNITRSTQQEVEVIVHLSMEDVPSMKNDLPQIKSSQESAKKRVSFDLPMIVEEVITKNADTSEVNIDDETIETINTGDQPGKETPLVIDDNIKDMILKKHNLDDLDLSPQFVYAKKKALQTISESDKVVTSKFFNEAAQIALNTDETSALKPDHQSQNKVIEIDENLMDQSMTQTEESTPITMENQAVTSSKSKEPENMVAGLLYNHGPQGIPESLDVSMNTTGFEDADGDFCLDNSLLLSPKADLEPTSGIAVGGSQDLPNFISGFRKTGLLFFGQKRQAEVNPDPGSDAQNEVQKFNFNFNGQENKSKKGLFSFFR